MKFRILIVSILILLVYILFTACEPKITSDGIQKHEETKEIVKTVKENDMSDYIVKNFEGEKINLFNGQKTYVKLWATWCSVCLSGLEEYNELAGMDTDFRVLNVVSPGHYNESNQEKLIKWWKGLEKDYPNIEILMDLEGQFFKDVGITAIPASVFINSNNEIIETFTGHKTNDEIFITMQDIE